MTARPDRITEGNIQASVFDALANIGMPGPVSWHPKNGGVHQASAGQRIRNATLGVRAGIQDVHILYEGRLYCLELKTHGGTESEVQVHLRVEMIAAGATCGVAYGIDQALAWLRQH